VKRLGQLVVEEVDKVGEFLMEIIDVEEVATADRFTRQDGESHLDLVE
jgi:hypothetical protein